MSASSVTAALAQRPGPAPSAAIVDRAVTSAVYTGSVTHRRLEPVPHGFRYRTAMLFLRLDEIDEVLGRHPAFSRRRGHPVRFHRGDYLGDPAVPLDRAVRDLVAERSGSRPRGPVVALTHLRTLGWCFNPVTAYYCYDPEGTQVTHQVLDVTNTPWGERHSYVIDVAGLADRDDPPGAWQARFAKELHVSPFMAMDQWYRLRAGPPGDALHLTLANEEQGRTVLRASLDLRRRPADRSGLGHLLVRYPLMTARVTAAIHWQALRIRAKGVPFLAHPEQRLPSPDAGRTIAR